MRRVFHIVRVLTIAAALVASGSTLRAQMTAPASGAATHEMHHVERYADLAIEPAQDCDHAMPAQNSSGKASCDDCCSACLTATMIASAPVQLVLNVARGEVLSLTRTTLIGRTVPIDPGIPKPSRT